MKSATAALDSSVVRFIIAAGIWGDPVVSRVRSVASLFRLVMFKNILSQAANVIKEFNRIEVIIIAVELHSGHIWELVVPNVAVLIVCRAAIFSLAFFTISNVAFFAETS